MPRKQGTVTAIDAAREHSGANLFTVELPPAALAMLQEKNERVKAAQLELTEAVATMLTMLDEPGIAKDVNLDTGVVTLMRVPALTPVEPGD